MSIYILLQQKQSNFGKKLSQHINISSSPPLSLFLLLTDNQRSMNKFETSIPITKKVENGGGGGLLMVGGPGTHPPP